MDKPAIAMKESFFQQVHLPHQKKLINRVVFPAVLSPNAPETNLLRLTEAVKSHKPWLEDLLQKSGAILFRGFPVDSPSDFNDVVEATGFPPMEYIGGGALRKQVLSRVYTANEAPPDQHIAFHHEMAYAAEFPSKLLLFCEVEPEKGGETPIVLSHMVYERMKEKYPAFVARLEDQGLLYTRIMSRDDDPMSPAGRGWHSTFSTYDKTIAEQRAAKVGMKLEWTDDGSEAVKILIGPKPAFRIDNGRRSKTWFNSMVVAHGGPTERDNKLILPEPVTFGDGTPLPADVVYDCIKILEDECVAIPWKKGDVLIIDNLSVLHSRRPVVNSQTRTRRVLASICK